ncbi:condensation domain-containing protein [Streptomyces rhizosphaericus]
MKFIDMHDLDVLPGLLTVWRPAPAGPHSTPWIPDPRPASYLQEAHIREACITDPGPRPPSWLATVFELPGELNAGALERALLGWIDRHESLRSRLLPHGGPGAGPRGGRVSRATLRAGTVAMLRTVVGDFPSGDELSHRIEALFDQETDPLTWPSFVFATVGHTDTESTTLYVGFDHSNVDGYSIFLIAHEIRELYAAALRGRPAELAEVGSFLDFAGSERAGAALVHSEHEAVAGWRDFVATNGGELPGFPAPPGTPASGTGAVGDVTGQGLGHGHAGAQAQAGGCEWLLDAQGAQAFQDACVRKGGNFFSGALACLAIVAHGNTGQQRFRAIAPFHTRTDPQWAQSVGWYVGLAPVGFAVRGTDAFREVMAEADLALKRAKPLATVPLPRITELLGMPLEPRFMVSYMDIRRTPGAEQWGEWRAFALRSRRIHPHEVFLWIMRSRRGVYLSFRYPDTEGIRTAVPRHIEQTGWLMEQIANEGSEDCRGKESTTC